MHYIEFGDAQKQLSAYLAKKLMGENMNEALCKRAQKLTDKWWSELKKPVLIAQADLMITGCTLGFSLGHIGVAQWKTRFVRDRFDLKNTVPNHIALGYVNGEQIYIADVNGAPHLCIRDTPTNVERWSPAYVLTPPVNTPMFLALERAKALGYLEHLKGQV